MKITKRQLKRIIREERAWILLERPRQLSFDDLRSAPEKIRATFGDTDIPDDAIKVSVEPEFAYYSPSEDSFYGNMGYAVPDDEVLNGIAVELVRTGAFGSGPERDAEALAVLDQMKAGQVDPFSGELGSLYERGDVMKITKRQLRRIIKEEKARRLQEMEWDTPGQYSKEEEMEYDRGYADGFNGHPEDEHGWGPYFAGWEDGDRRAKLEDEKHWRDPRDPATLGWAS